MADAGLPSTRAVYLLTLSFVAGVGPVTAIQAARAFKNPADLFAASPQDLASAVGARAGSHLGALRADQWPELLERAETQVATHERMGIHVVAVDDEGYPPLMALAPRPAPVLYARGELRALRSPDAVAVIGTRGPTLRGLEVAHLLARSMAESNFVIVSGLALGIDTAGHEGALQLSRPTVAVLGTAIDKVYPASNRHLSERIVESGGALISEYPVGYVTSGRHFVERDRLQAAMSIAVIVVQTGLEGGAMHTVRFAIEAKRPVLVPRPVESEANEPAYEGIRDLITTGRAGVIETREDYPRVVRFLREHRDSLLTPGMPRPTFTQTRLDL